MGQRETPNHLPREIIEEILYVLPVKTLLRFKCVSKSWRSLISSKEFIKEHLKKSNKDVEFPHCKLKLSSNQSQKSVEFKSLFRNNPNSLNPCHLRSLFDNPIITSSDNHLSDSFYMAQIVGSCHGLILMTISWRYLCLWNPCTRKIRKVVPPSAYFPQGQQFVYGLGYDEYTDDYKIVCIHIPYMNNYQTEMYSSKSDSWKKIENFDKGLPVCDFGNLVNGRLHWMAMSDGGDLVIVSLDLVEEKYGIVAYPENYVNPSPLQPILKNLGGYLCLINRSTSARDNRDVWVMLKYGERESWTKVWTLSGIHDPMMKLIGDYGPDFVVYNQKNRLLCYKSRFDMLDATNMKSSIFYVESLVSPFGDEELCL